MATKTKRARGPVIEIQKLVTVGEVEIGTGSRGMMEEILRQMGKDLDFSLQNDHTVTLARGATYSFEYDGLTHTVGFETNIAALEAQTNGFDPDHDPLDTY